MTTTRSLRVDDPYTGEIACEVPWCTAGAAASAVTRAAEAQVVFARVPLRERVALALGFAEALAAGREDAAREITSAMGKPVRDARREVDVAVERARAHAALAEEALAERRLPRRWGVDRSVSREPLGVVLQIAPWNDPLLATVSVVVPAVLAGNAVLLRPSTRTPLSGGRVADAFARAGAPAGLVQSLVLQREAVGALMERAEIGLVTFAGMPNPAHAVHRRASVRFRQVTLQIFGKDSAYVAEDADLDRAAESLSAGAFGNAGQGCSSVQRVYVSAAVEEPFLERLVAAARSLVPDDPMDESTALGPLAEPELPPIAAHAVAEARSHAARVLCGGARAWVDGRGRFFAPTVVASANHRMALMADRILGPLVGVMRVDGDASATQLMTMGRHDLTASVWTSSPERALAMARGLRAVTVCHNHCAAYSDLPWSVDERAGPGSSTSAPGFLDVTRPRSFHVRTGG
jgi:acyl-CoA reductase-like NAD-dependent aldehyde dehydrogenase